MTAIEKGPGVGLSTSALDSIRLAGNPFFADGDYEGGVLAILSALEFQLGGDVVSVATTATTSASSESTDSSGGVPATGLILLAVAGLTSGAVVWTSSRNKRISQTKRARADRVDGLLARLEVSGHELPQVEDFAVATAQGSSVSTGEALDVLAAVAVAELVEDVGSIAAPGRGGTHRCVRRRGTCWVGRGAPGAGRQRRGETYSMSPCRRRLEQLSRSLPKMDHSSRWPLPNSVAWSMR